MEKHNLLTICALLLICYSCGESKSPIDLDQVITGAIHLKYQELTDKEKESIDIDESCCFPHNWNMGEDCLDLDSSFFVRVELNNNLLAKLTESRSFTIEELFSRPDALYGKYKSKWGCLI